MDDLLLHQAIKQKFLECRRATHEGIMTLDEADDKYVNFCEELVKTYGHNTVEEVVNQFTNDLRVLNWMKRIDWLGPFAMAAGFVTGYLVSEARIARIINLNDAILRLDAEYYEPEPGDTS